MSANFLDCLKYRVKIETQWQIYTECMLQKINIYQQIHKKFNTDTLFTKSATVTQKCILVLESQHKWTNVYLLRRTMNDGWRPVSNTPISIRKGLRPYEVSTNHSPAHSQLIFIRKWKLKNVNQCLRLRVLHSFTQQSQICRTFVSTSTVGHPFYAVAASR